MTGPKHRLKNVSSHRHKRWTPDIQNSSGGSAMLVTRYPKDSCVTPSRSGDRPAFSWVCRPTMRPSEVAAGNESAWGRKPLDWSKKWPFPPRGGRKKITWTFPSPFQRGPKVSPFLLPRGLRRGPIPAAAQRRSKQRQHDPRMLVASVATGKWLSGRMPIIMREAVGRMNTAHVAA